MSSFDAYEVLEIERDADAATIRRAYQKLARRHHPELHPGDPDAASRFRAIEEAFRMLSDPRLRRRHDAGLPAESSERPEAGGQTRARIVTARYFEVYAERFSLSSSDDGVAGPGAAPRAPERFDLDAEVTIDFAEMVRGTLVSLSVQRERGCEDCEGTGRASGGGCPRCMGRGVLVDLERVRARLPPAVEDGTRLRLRGRGQQVPGAKGSAPHAAGDLYVTVRVRPHPYFARDGLDVRADLPIRFTEAALGGEVDVPTIDGRVRVRLPAGTAGGQRFRLRGRGLRAPDGAVGDHIYRVRIVVPRTLDPAVRAVFARISEDDPRAELPTAPL